MRPFLILILVLSFKVSFNKVKNLLNDNQPIISLAEESNKYLKGFGYWLFGRDMESVKLKDLSKNGVTDIFLNFYAFTLYDRKKVISFISSAKNENIRIHIWMQAFYRDGKWINPKNCDFTPIINEAKNYASVPGVAGVHLDYLRYPEKAYLTTGGVDSINKFIGLLVKAVHDINSKCIISAAIMPETTTSKHDYGQDYDVISKYMNVVVPMIYKGNYRANRDWIKRTTKWYVQNSKGAAIWAGLQSYRSDDDITKLSLTELDGDIKAAMSENANGVMLFRWGLSNSPSFSHL